MNSKRCRKNQFCSNFYRGDILNSKMDLSGWHDCLRFLGYSWKTLDCNGGILQERSHA